MPISTPETTLIHMRTTPDQKAIITFSGITLIGELFNRRSGVYCDGKPVLTFRWTPDEDITTQLVEPIIERTIEAASNLCAGAVLFTELPRAVQQIFIQKNFRQTENVSNMYYLT